MRIRKHGGLVDVNKSGGVEVTPFTGQGMTVTGPSTFTGPLTQTGATIQNTIKRESLVVPLTAAQILGMFTAPVTLVPAPGAGKCVIVDNITVKMTTTATAFTDGGAIEFRYTNGAGAKVAADVAAAVVTAGAGTSFTNVRGVEASLTGVANAAVVMTNATEAFADGTGTAQVVVDYHVV